MRVIFLWRINTSSGRSRFGSWIAPIMRMTAMEISTPAIQTAGYLISHVVTGMVDRAINTDRIKHPILVLQWKPSEYLLITTKTAVNTAISKKALKTSAKMPIRISPIVFSNSNWIEYA